MSDQQIVFTKDAPAALGPYVSTLCQHDPV